jgi:hypothetical protein
MNTDITVLKHLTAIRLDVMIWSARRKLSAADLANADLPPENVASLGAKKVCNPEDLRVFATLKARAVALLDRHGVRFLSGWMIPETAIKAVNGALETIAADFITAKEDFLGRYDQAVRDWIGQNLGWEALIAGATVPADMVRARLGFGWQMFKIAPPRKADVGQGLRDAVTSLGQTLFGEVARAADDAWQKSFAGKLEASAKALSPIRTLRAKLAGLTFVEPRVAPVVDLLDAALTVLPGKGPISGANLVMAQGLVCLLRDPAALVDHGQKIIDGHDPDRMVRELVALPSSVPVAIADDEDMEGDIPFHDPMPAIDSLGLW